MTQQKILEAAARLFSERGFASTPTSLLAREAGISEGSIYRHFSSKDEIFLHLIRDLRQELENAIDAVLEESSPLGGFGQISSILEEYSAFVRKNSRYFSLIFRDAPLRAGHGDTELQDELAAIHDYIHDCIFGVLKRGADEGTIRNDIDVKTVCTMVCSLVLGMTRMRYFGYLSEDQIDPAAVRSHLELFLRPVKKW